MIALITGASSGFGRAIALKFAEHGWDVIITGRRKEKLEELEHIILDTYETKVYSLCFDVRDRKQVKIELDALPHFWKEIDVLVNNAGLASGMSAIYDGDIDDWEKMIDTNVKGLLYVSRTILPWMIERKRGHVINIGSTAGKDAYAYGNVYCGSKFAVDAITKSMRIDLLPHGIKVTAVNPGAAETEFSLVRFKGDTEKAKSIYKGFDPLQANDIAEVVWFAASRPPHVNLNDIVMTPLAQANSVYINKK
ncbi:MAG: SDR family NAD(P)-dependent oxidoreductase [Bacteroidia bacterium]|jgi:3-hydroxy acid dehydrogenase/malonic semialdehyde reductase|nr:SDR family NAD(P)-dependent oxidoreductase [Bacteroidota bacterium]MBP6512837.1 SDR family NAD(P)-dependent oxidoreductase [Bacteroidia bacterium]MBP7245966.1 SDR family NAD(P)-dependent oxidoreductase [Bacteroidia bacterium]